MTTGKSTGTRSQKTLDTRSFWTSREIHEVTAAFSKCYFTINWAPKKNEKEGTLPLKRTKRNLNCNYVKLFWTHHVLYVDIWFGVILLNNLLIQGTQWHETMVVLPTYKVGRGENWSKMMFGKCIRRFIEFEVNRLAFHFIHVIISEKWEIISGHCTVKNHCHHHHFFFF